MVKEGYSLARDTLLARFAAIDKIGYFRRLLTSYVYCLAVRVLFHL
jgi:hypothetical protein